MHSVFDPLLAVQLVAAVLIVLTLPDAHEPQKTAQASTPIEREPFQLGDGNTYVEHAGMAVEVHRIRCLNITL